MECIIELANDIDHFIVNVVHHLFNNDRRFLRLDTLEEILPIVTIKYQTMAYYGFDPEELKAFVQKYRPVGLDRIVPFGETTAFALKWDGYNLIETFSRIPSIL